MEGSLPLNSELSCLPREFLIQQLSYSQELNHQSFSSVNFIAEFAYIRKAIIIWGKHQQI